jgi:hypothetical protein
VTSTKKRLLTIDRHWRLLDDGGFEFDVVAQTPGRWVRFGVFLGEAPGSHMAGKHATAWQTRLGEFHGWNARFGNWPYQCLTLLLHTRPGRDA